MADYEFYTGVYLGNSMTVGDFSRLAKRAETQIAAYKRRYAVSGETGAEDMAVCAMADVLYYFEQTPQSVSVGGVSQTDRQYDEKHELYRTARQYLDIYRGG